MTQIKLSVVIILFLLFIPSVFATEKTSALKFEEHKGMAVPDDVPIFDEFDKKHYLEEYEGKALLLVFWATWCSPCVQEMLDLDTLQKDFRKLPFVILPVAEDYQGVKTVEAFYKQNDIRHLPILHDYRNALFNAFSVVGMPTSFLITEEGMSVVTFKGMVNWHDDEVRAILLSHIPGNPAEPKNTYKVRSLNQVVQKPKPQAFEALKALKVEDDEDQDDEDDYINEKPQPQKDVIKGAKK